MNRDKRKALIAAYKEIKPRPGIFAVRCATTGEVWVSAAPNLDNRQNGLWAGLRTGGHPNKAMQAAWTAHGEAGFAFEVVETIDDETLSAIGLADQIKARERHWLEKLSATKAVG